MLKKNKKQKQKQNNTTSSTLVKPKRRKKKKEKELSGAHLCLVAKKVKVKYEQFCPNLFCPFFSPYLG